MWKLINLSLLSLGLLVPILCGITKQVRADTVNVILSTDVPLVVLLDENSITKELVDNEKGLVETNLLEYRIYSSRNFNIHCNTNCTVEISNVINSTVADDGNFNPTLTELKAIISNQSTTKEYNSLTSTSSGFISLISGENSMTLAIQAVYNQIPEAGTYRFDIQLNLNP